MVDAGLTLDEGIVDTFNELKMKHTYQYLIFRLSDDYSKVILDKQGDKGESYEDMVASLPADKPRYIVFDYNHTTADGRNVNKLIYIQYTPDIAKVKDKLVSASSTKLLQTNLQGIAITVHASDVSDLDEQEVVKKLK